VEITMTDALSPFPSMDIEPEPEEPRQYWGSLLRGHNNMPFWDDLKRRAPFDFLESRAEATVECAKPTYYRTGDHSRILPPMWGDGRIGMLPGAVMWR
jgi:hypothetical protein